MKRPLVLALSLLFSMAPMAQQGADIGGTIVGGGQAIPIAVPAPIVPGHQAIVDEIVETIRNDLDYSGHFTIVDPGLYKLVPEPGSAEENFDAWTSIGSETGSSTDTLRLQ